VPLIFAACCLFMLYSSVSYALARRPVGLLLLVGILLAGGLLFWSTEVRRRG